MRRILGLAALDMAKLCLLLVLFTVSANAHPHYFASTSSPSSDEGSSESLEGSSESAEVSEHSSHHSMSNSQEGSEHSSHHSMSNSQEGSEHNSHHSSSSSQEGSKHNSEHSSSSSQDGSERNSQQSLNKSQEGSRAVKNSSAVLATGSEDELSRIVQRAFENGELLRRSEWLQTTRRRINKNVQRDTSRHESTPMSLSTTQMGEKDNRGDSSSKGLMLSDDGIVFPKDNEPSSPTYKPHLAPAPKCEGETYCVGAPHYPEDLVNRALQQNSSLGLFGSVDVTDVVGRIGDPTEVVLCGTTEQVIFPKSAESEHKQWHWIINQENLKQGVRVEKCLNEGTPCEVFEGVIDGYKTSCEQKYIYRELMAVMHDGSIGPGNFKFPTSCCCHVKFTGDAATRMGLSLGHQGTTPVKRRRRK